MNSLADHGLPLVRLKEQRQDLVVFRQRTRELISGWQLLHGAALQQIVAACEEVLVDLDAEGEARAFTTQNNIVCLHNL
jgi:hypothetical protein